MREAEDRVCGARGEKESAEEASNVKREGGEEGRKRKEECEGRDLVVRERRGDDACGTGAIVGDGEAGAEENALTRDRAKEGHFLRGCC